MINITKAQDLLALIATIGTVSPVVPNRRDEKFGSVTISTTQLTTSYVLSREWLISELQRVESTEQLVTDDTAFDIRDGDSDYGFVMIDTAGSGVFFVQRIEH